MKYIKFDENGNAFEAPAKMKTEAGTIFGYNSEKNEKTLLADGWLKYEGNTPLSRLKLENGEIVEVTMTTAPSQNKSGRAYTKLEIRRALRKLNKENVLDGLLAHNPTLKKDWDDAQVIRTDDEMIQAAVEKGIIPKELLALLANELK